MDLADLKRWLDEYGRVWEQGDVDGCDGLYTPDIKYYEDPFSPPEDGIEAVRGYIIEAAATQRDVTFSSEAYTANGETGIARWHASFNRVPSGAHVELDGVFVLKFDDDQKCRELREWWHRVESKGDTA